MSQPRPSNIPDYFPDDLPRFRLGERVLHVRYGYRGVVVDFDMSCHADEQWVQSNPTQPDLKQPWYHVLVHGSTGNTYVAQDNLIADPSDDEVKHALVAEFFDGYENGRYERNDAKWPSW